MACPANPYLGNPPRAMEFADSTQYRFWAEIIVVAFPFCWMTILVLWSLKYHLFRHCCHFKILNCGFIWVLEFPKPSQNLSMPKKNPTHIILQGPWFRGGFLWARGSFRGTSARVLAGKYLKHPLASCIPLIIMNLYVHVAFHCITPHHLRWCEILKMIEI